MLKQFLRTDPFSTDYAALLLRLSFGIMMLPYGYSKLNNFSQRAPEFLDFLGMGTTTSLALAIFAELFCSILVILGLFTRISLVPLMITMFVALVTLSVKKEHPLVFLFPYITLFVLGPGRFSLDYLLFGRRVGGKSP